MNIVLWILQILLALHTLMGAVWKFTNPEQTVPSLQAIPHSVWIAISVVEIFCSIALVLPAFKKSLGSWVPRAAMFIGAVMIAYCALHIGSGHAHETGPMIYWIVVAAFCAFIAYARLKLKPIR